MTGTGKHASGAATGLRATSFVIRDGKAVAAVLDTHEDEAAFLSSLYEAAAAAGLVAREVAWQTAHELLSGPWETTIAAAADAHDEATYLRPWVERAILGRADGPASKGRIVGDGLADHDGAEGPAGDVLESASGFLRERGAAEEVIFAAEAIWGDFLEASEEPVLADDAAGWSAALVLRGRAGHGDGHGGGRRRAGLPAR